MCGIVGFVGRGPAAAPILDALRRLEYRGYDFGRYRHHRARCPDAAARSRKAKEPRELTYL